MMPSCLETASLNETNASAHCKIELKGSSDVTSHCRPFEFRLGPMRPPPAPSQNLSLRVTAHAITVRESTRHLVADRMYICKIFTNTTDVQIDDTPVYHRSEGVIVLS